MNIRLFLVVGVCILTAACQNRKNDSKMSAEGKKTEIQFELPDSLSTTRLSFVLDLKKAVAEQNWIDFGKKRTEGTLIYFNDDKSEVFFPSQKVLKRLNTYDTFSDDYVLTSRIDNIPSHMEVMISFDEADSSQYFFENPVEQYSSVEEVGKIIQSVESTEMWSTMVVHEMFHHYQYNNENYLEYAKSKIGVLPFSIRDLITICQEDEHFLPMIRKENDYLMQAISEDNHGIRDSLISSYLDARTARIQKYSEVYPNLEQVENYYIIQEGSARYIEYKSMFILSDYAKKTDPSLVLDDPMFRSYSEFKDIDLNDPAFNYLVYAASSDYHYTLGFNTMRLLDELKVDYKSQLLNNPEKGIHEYLEAYINMRSN